jgi:hypothetical protein
MRRTLLAILLILTLGSCLLTGYWRYDYRPTVRVVGIRALENGYNYVGFAVSNPSSLWMSGDIICERIADREELYWKYIQVGPWSDKVIWMTLPQGMNYSQCRLDRNY